MGLYVAPYMVMRPDGRGLERTPVAPVRKPEIHLVSYYYCYKCARDCGHITPVDPSRLNATKYQFDKFIKHTAPTGVYHRNSVFDADDWATYERYCVTTAASGCLEVDDQGRKNLIWFAGERVGLLDDGQSFRAPCSGIKLVCCEDEARLHPFATDFRPESRTCEKCGARVPYDPR